MTHLMNCGSFDKWTLGFDSRVTGCVVLGVLAEVGATLEKLNLPRHHWLKEVEQAPEKSTVRRTAVGEAVSK